MAKIYKDVVGDTCIRFDNNTGWWSTTYSRPNPLPAKYVPWVWSWEDNQEGCPYLLAEVPESEARALAAKGGPWCPQPFVPAATSAQVWAAVFGAAYCVSRDASAAARTADVAVRELGAYRSATG